MLKVLKQCSISNLFSILAYKRIKIKLLKVLHARVIDCSLALWVRQFKPECSNCVGHMHNGLCTGCPYRSPALVVKLAEKISATAEQENGRENNRRNVEQF